MRRGLWGASCGSCRAGGIKSVVGRWSLVVGFTLSVFRRPPKPLIPSRPFTSWPRFFLVLAALAGQPRRLSPRERWFKLPHFLVLLAACRGLFLRPRHACGCVPGPHKSTARRT